MPKDQPAAQLSDHVAVVQAKFMDDKYFTNKYYAQVGGVALEELNCLELELLRRLDYRAHVDVPEMCACLQVLMGIWERLHGMARGAGAGRTWEMRRGGVQEGGGCACLQEEC